MLQRTVLLLAWTLLLPGSSRAAAPPTIDVTRLTRIDTVVREAIDQGNMPGAVVLVLHRGEVVYRKAHGNRAVEPGNVPMTADTLFDLASLTKPIATASSIFLLIEQGKLTLGDRVGMHWPEFGKNGKEKITVEHLLTHTSGLLADNALADYAQGHDAAMTKICQLKPLAAPGERFLYSDVGFVILGELVQRLSGESVAEFSHKHLFAPLGMKETGFCPEEKLRQRAAPTEKVGERWLKGEVHDPRARLLGGVAGHAGLFSTTDDLAIFARLLLEEGRHQGKQILSPATVRTLTTPYAVPGGWRTRGWDMDTGYSGNRGDLFPRRVSFGHTGFTGTSLWLDPQSQTAVIFLSNRVHPRGKGNVTRVRSQVSTLVASALGTPPPLKRIPVLTGIDVLVRERFARLKGRKVGLITNQTGRDQKGQSTIDLLFRAPEVKLVALFSPEHGIRGSVDARVPDGKDEKTGLPIYSLYGERRKPTAEQLKGIDTLIYDIQDAGCRFYTYMSTLGLVMEAAAENGLTVVVLDRPNPINGRDVEGPVRDAGTESFVAFHPLPVRHGMTLGELALLFNAERKTSEGKPIRCELEVVRMEGWRRSDFLDRTGLPWINPSPNLRSLTGMYLYPGIGLLETTNLSVGRGTDRPFEWVGAPWIDERKLAGALQGEELPGVRVIPVRLTPNSSPYRGKDCGGVQLIIEDWARFQPVHTGMVLATTLRRLYREEWKTERLEVLLCHKGTSEGIRRGTVARDLERAWQRGVTQFLERRRPYLLYPE